MLYYIYIKFSISGAEFEYSVTTFEVDLDGVKFTTLNSIGYSFDFDQMTSLEIGRGKKVYNKNSCKG